MPETILIVCEEKMEKTFNNPVWEPILADPSIIRDENGVWYAAACRVRKRVRVFGYPHRARYAA